MDDQVWHRAVGGSPAGPGDMFGQAVAMGDFDGDGFDDLAVGIPGANIDSEDNAGAVYVIYGSEDGLANGTQQEFARGVNGVDGTSLEDEYFGQTLASGDFDHDGYADLAIAAPYAEVDGDPQAGTVNILYGRSSGLGIPGQEVITQDANGGAGTSAEPTDVFGYSLAAGDYDGDGIDDLAVGSPFEDNGEGYDNAGVVQVYYGESGATAASSGLLTGGSVNNAQYWSANSEEVQGAMEAGEWFGYSLAAADFNGDGRDDLAVGIPHESHGSGPGTIVHGGAINVFQGSATGLVSTVSKPAYLWHQESTGIIDEVAAMEQFGQSLAAGDFDNDGYADLAIGVPGNKLLDLQIGATHLMFGSSSGLNTTGNRLLFDPVLAEVGQWFGRSVTAGDYNGDGFVDLVVGAPRDNPDGVSEDNSGSIFAFYSDDTGPVQNVYQNFWPGHLYLKGAADTNDYFGSALAGSPYRP
jgi:hypothetical protein